MKHLLLVLFAAVIGFGMMSQEAEARRFGGGRTSGISRDSSLMRSNALPATPVAPAQAAAPAPAPAPAGVAKPGMSRWLGPLAGLAAGIGLASLFSHLGMGEGMGNMLLLIALAMAALFLVRWFMSRRQSGAGMEYAGNAVSSRFDAARQMPASAPIALGTSAAEIQAPANFDVEGFLRQAKLNFVRLQAANDRGDMEDIRQFTSPEMFAEVQLDYQDRGRNTQQTDVIELKADLLDVTAEAARHIASVRFHGLLREQADATPETFSEVWHLSKPSDGSRNWIVAGIQQG